MFSVCLAVSFIAGTSGIAFPQRLFLHGHETMATDIPSQDRHADSALSFPVRARSVRVMDYQAALVVGWIIGAAFAAVVLYGLVRLAVGHGIGDAQRKNRESE